MKPERIGITTPAMELVVEEEGEVEEGTMVALDEDEAKVSQILGERLEIYWSSPGCILINGTRSGDGLQCQYDPLDATSSSTIQRWYHWRDGETESELCR